MKYLVLMLLVTVSFAQQKQERYQIEKLGTIDGTELVILLDTQSGKCWQMLQDTSVFVRTYNGGIAKQQSYVFVPMLFAPNMKPMEHRFTPEIDTVKK